MWKILTAFALIVLTANFAPATYQSEHEYAPIITRNLRLYDFSLKTVDGETFNLRTYTEDKRLIIINFSAAWCRNSNLNARAIRKLYDKFKDRGLGVVVVMEYSNQEGVHAYIDRFGIKYPVAIDTDRLEDRETSLHFKYRRQTEDKRKWGTPFYMIIDARDLGPPKSDSPLATWVYVVAGEVVESEMERFIEEHLADTTAR